MRTPHINCNCQQCNANTSIGASSLFNFIPPNPIPNSMIFPQRNSLFSPEKENQYHSILARDLNGDYYLIPLSEKDNWNEDVIKNRQKIPKYAEYIIELEELVIKTYEIRE